MKHLMTVTALAIAAAAGMNTARAADVQAKIPFDFFAGDKKLSAGSYWIGHAANGKLVTLRSDSGHRNAFVIVNPIQTHKTNAPKKLLFRRIGDQYVLGQIWDGTVGGRETMRSRSEKTLMREAGHAVAVRVVEIPIAAE